MQCLILVVVDFHICLVSLVLSIFFVSPFLSDFLIYFTLYRLINSVRGSFTSFSRCLITDVVRSSLLLFEVQFNNVQLYFYNIIVYYIVWCSHCTRDSGIL